MSRAADPCVRQAIEWMTLLNSGAVSGADRQRFEAWHAADARHAAAWRAVEQALRQPFSAIRETGQASTASAILRQPPPRRRMLLKTLALAVGGAGMAWLANRQFPVTELTADLSTGTAQRRRFVLADGSEIMLNARSAADLAFDGRARRVRLRSGAVYVRVAADPGRPFIVSSADGDVRGNAAEFMVARHRDSSVLSVLAGMAELDAADARQAVRQGEGVRFGRHGIGTPDRLLASQAAWRRGMLVVQDESLGAVIEALRPYRRGYLRISAPAARLRVLGTLPLDDTDTALAALAQTLPISVSHYGGWLVNIDLAGPRVAAPA